MATPLGWSQGGSGSVCLAFDQLRDVIESQEELIHQLRNVVGSQGSGKGRAGRLPVGAGPGPRRMWGAWLVYIEKGAILEAGLT